MLVLVLDTATAAVTAAVAEFAGHGPGDADWGFAIRAQLVTVDGRAHGELLAPQIEAALKQVGAKPSDLAAIVAGVGPGPFTGLRVGLVTAGAIGHTLQIPVYGVCSLDALARDAPGAVLAATDARRREIYWAEYADGRRLRGPAVDAPADVRTGASRAVGDGAVRYADVLGLPVDEPRYPPAAALAALAADRIRSGAPAEPLAPLYLRRPDAAMPAARKAVRKAVRQ